MTENALELELADEDVGDLSLLEAAAKPTPMSHSSRQGRESLRSWGKRLQKQDKSLAAAAKKKGRSGSAHDEKKHPRGRSGLWTMRSGSKGTDVKMVQRHVGAIDDGKFGDQTTKAVRAFQQRRGLKVDGVVGAQTVAEMRKKGAGRKVKPGALSAGAKVPRIKPRQDASRGGVTRI